MNFGEAIQAIKAGAKMTRVGWNGKGTYVVYRSGYPEGIPANKSTAEALGIPEGSLFKCRPYLQMRCADGTFQMWLASQSDILADDWREATVVYVPEEKPLALTVAWKDMQAYNGVFAWDEEYAEAELSSGTVHLRAKFALHEGVKDAQQNGELLLALLPEAFWPKKTVAFSAIPNGIVTVDEDGILTLAHADGSPLVAGEKYEITCGYALSVKG